jgi:quercetin dioxygenase-like cupin family protein
LCPLNARAAKDNTASIRVLEKCEFAIRGEDEGFSNARGVEVEEFILELQANAGSSPRFERSVEVRKEDAGVFVGPEGGKALVNPIGGRMVAKLSDEDTGGAYSIHDNTIPPGSPGPRPHVHRHHEEAFYVLEGELTVQVGARRITAPAGSFVVVPRGAVHQPSNPGTEPTRVLLIFSPAGMERFFEEAAEGRMPLQAEPEDPAVRERLAAFTERYGYEFAELTPT